MAHYKRGRAKSARSGCLHCKPHKHQRAKDKLQSQPTAVQRVLLGEQADAREHQRHASRRKPFAIEWRRMGRGSSGILSWLDFDWKAHRRYATEAARDQALRTLQRGAFAQLGYEYRAA